MKFRITISAALFILLSLFFALFCSCSGGELPSDTAVQNESTAETSAEEWVLPETISYIDENGKCPFIIVYDTSLPEGDRAETLSILDGFYSAFGVLIATADDSPDVPESQYEIIVASDKRSECTGLASELSEGEYAIKCIVSKEKTSIVIACNGADARTEAIRYFTNNCIDSGSISSTFDYRGEIVMHSIFEADIPWIRDPSVIFADGVYYMYSTGWMCWHNSTGLQATGWEGPDYVVQLPEENDAEKDYWAPEVHIYNGAYYMITTYYSHTRQHRGCTVLRSDSPLGPFTEISDGPVTPADWDAIDGTLYIDPDGQPWMVFVHEWVSTDDKVGRMAAAKLSDDLTSLISEPVELFRADDAPWTSNNVVTDGCYMYRMKSSGTLLMIWSNYSPDGYCIGIARSKSGSIEGPWTQDETRLYSKGMLPGDYDGGHGMLFYDENGQIYLVFHSPNTATDDRNSIPVFIPIIEDTKNDTLVWGTNPK